MRKVGRHVFPDPRSADDHGLVAVTHALNVELLLEAYSRGLFPWTEHPVRWFSPDPRAIFLRDYVRLPRRLGRTMRKQGLTVTFDEAFDEVIRGCAQAHAHDGVWISDGFVRAYSELHEQGHAHSVEVWRDDQLVGGLYGVQLMGLFAGESMFYRVPNASKVAFAHLIGQLDLIGTRLIDCQVLNDHTARLGAVTVSRDDYLRLLAHAMEVPCRYAGTRWPKDPPPPPKNTDQSGEGLDAEDDDS